MKIFTSLGPARIPALACPLPWSLAGWCLSELRRNFNESIDHLHQHTACFSIRPGIYCRCGAQSRHTVEAFECLFTKDLASELKAHITRFQPDVIGISIRLVHGFIIDPEAEFNTRHLDLRKRVKQVVECIKQVSSAQIVLGGPGFNYYGRDWLEYWMSTTDSGARRIFLPIIFKPAGK